SVNNGKRQPTH
ncbi:hypothetical protein D049_3501B, partial [Vibrio parahaemolyticus VPTS-2010]